jgi:hypothetical protein
LLHELAGAKAELLALLERRADDAAERAAIEGESALPRPGSPERERVDNTQIATLAGLMIAADGRRFATTGRKMRATARTTP